MCTLSRFGRPTYGSTKLLANTHVNLVDFISSPGERVRTFPSEEALSKYTRETSKYFPRENVYAGSLLKCLLRNILNPSQTRSGRGLGRSRGTGRGGRRRGIGF